MDLNKIINLEKFMTSYNSKLKNIHSLENFKKKNKSDVNEILQAL